MEKDLNRLRIDREKKKGGSSPDSGWRILVSVFLVIGLLAVAYFWVFSDEQSGSETVTTAVAADPPDTPDTTMSSEVLIVSGYVVAHHKIDVGSKVMGKVSWVGVERGEQVQKGQLLVKLDDREYVARMKEAKGALQLAKARLAELEAGSRPQEIQRAEAELRRSEAELLNAGMELERLAKLLTTGVVSLQEVDNARARNDTFEASVGVARKTLELLRIGPREEQIEQARAEVNRLEASVEYAQTLLDATEIRAPITGTVLERIVETGEMVTTSFAGNRGAKSSVIALADLNDIQVELDISQSDFNRISEEQTCTMTPEAYPDRHYRCEIAEISPEANRQKATIQVKVQILDPDGYLRPEMTARVTFSEPPEGG